MENKKQFIARRTILFFSAIVVFLLSYTNAAAQEMPPRPVCAHFVQNLCFGAFCPSFSGGTVTVTPFGIRFATGGVFLVNQGYPYYSAIFGLEGNPGTIVHLLSGPDVILSGSNGGTMTMHLGDFYPGDPIIINAAPPSTMQILVGGTLVVGNLLDNPPGFYSGSFYLIFIQE